MASSSSSGLTFKLHPLVIVNISDHYTRVKSQMNPPVTTSTNNGGVTTTSTAQPPRVYGCVIGVQRGRTVEIFNSFELLYDPITHSLERAFVEKKQELYKKVFPHFYILGWYSTGSDAEESDMHIHKALMDINESPVYVLLNPSINRAQKDLPVTIYESELHVIDGIPQLIFVRSSYTIETVEAERISVDHVAHLKPSDGGSAATQWLPHLCPSLMEGLLENSTIEEASWLCSLSQSELDMLISLKMMVIRRAKLIGCEELSSKFDPKMLRALALVLMEYLKGNVKNLTHIPGLAKSMTSMDACSLLQCEVAELLSIDELKTCIGVDEKKR